MVQFKNYIDYIFRILPLICIPGAFSSQAQNHDPKENASLIIDPSVLPAVDSNPSLEHGVENLINSDSNDIDLLTAVSEAFSGDALPYRDLFSPAAPPAKPKTVVSSSKFDYSMVKPHHWPMIKSWFRRRNRRSHKKGSYDYLRPIFNYTTGQFYIKSGQASIGILDEDVYIMFHEILIRCLPVSESSLDLGFYRVVQSNKFKVECDKGKTRPLYTYEEWECDPRFIFADGYFVPTMCVDKRLPQKITMSRMVTLYGLMDHKCGVTAKLDRINAYWKASLKTGVRKSFKVDGFGFNFHDAPLGGNCNGILGDGSAKNQIYQMTVNVVFQVWHQPKGFNLKKTTRGEVAKILDGKVNLLMEKLKEEHYISHFTMDDGELKFKATTCETGSAVERFEKFFDQEIPPCRICDRGLFLDEKEHKCKRCKRGSYSNHGSTSCERCPIAESKGGVSADSLHDCYALPVCLKCYWQAIVEGLVIFFLYHIAVFGVLVWNLRHSLLNRKPPVPEAAPSTVAPPNQRNRSNS